MNNGTDIQSRYKLISSATIIDSLTRYREQFDNGEVIKLLSSTCKQHLTNAF